MPAPRMVFLRLRDAIREKRALTAGEAKMIQGTIAEKMIQGTTASKELFSELLACLPAAGDSEASGSHADELARCDDLLFAVCCSPSGFEVHVSGAADSAVGIVILGFSGGSLKALAPVTEQYRKFAPSWRIVATTSPNVSCLGDRGAALAEEQVQRVAKEVSGCGRIFVHAMSNNGFGLWIRAQQAHPALADRLVGAVFDCGISANPTSGGSFSADGWMTVLSATILGVMVAEGWTPSEPQPVATARREAIGRIEPACRLAAARLANLRDPFGPLHAWQLEHEPAVPTLCLTSPTDAVIPAASVHKFAERLRSHQPSRRVSEASLAGSHCRLFESSPREYAGAIQTFVSSTLEGAGVQLVTEAQPASVVQPASKAESAAVAGDQPAAVAIPTAIITYDPELDEPVGSMAKVEELQDALLADDVTLTPEMATWSLRRLTHCLESGGDDQPSLMTDVVMPGHGRVY